MHTLALWFYHNVWGNLVASSICTGLAYLKLRAEHRKHHRQLMQAVQGKVTES